MRVIHLVVASSLAAPLLFSGSARAQEPDGELGTVEVDGSSGNNASPLPKVAIVPLLSLRLADSVLQQIARDDLSLSGQFEVLREAALPRGPHLPGMPIDLEAWRKTGAGYLVRVQAQPGANGGQRLVAELFLLSESHEPETPPRSFQTAVDVDRPEDLRMASHRVVDELLGALTGRPGGFASRMVFAADGGGFRRAFVLDSDGSDLHAASPSDGSALSPAFGPGGQVYYAYSHALSPFRLAFGLDAVSVPVEVQGSLLGLAFSADRSQMALALMSEGNSAVYVATGGQLREVTRAPFANHPAFGPGGRLAFVAGTPVQRVYVDQKPISPAGLMASSPAFCDTPQGLLVFYTIKVGTGSDVVASSPNGTGLRRYTQQQGENRDPACSPDGRVLALFSTRGSGQGPGLYVMPVNRPWLARKISDRIGGSLRWEAAWNSGGGGS